MDTAVGLVDAWLRLNGYFTVTEFPVLARGRGTFQTVTDLDVLAVRFAHAASMVPGASIACAHAPVMEMIIGEVKEGKALLNEAASNAAVLKAALSRFGCCPPDHLDEVVRRLLHDGKTTTAQGHLIRRVAFGSIPCGQRAAWETVLLGDVLADVRRFLADNWEALRHAQFKDPTLALLALALKAEGSGAAMTNTR